jgi:hypothetical protein
MTRAPILIRVLNSRGTRYVNRFGTGTGRITSANQVISSSSNSDSTGKRVQQVNNCREGNLLIFSGYSRLFQKARRLSNEFAVQKLENVILMLNTSLSNMFFSAVKKVNGNPGAEVTAVSFVSFSVTVFSSASLLLYP